MTHMTKYYWLKKILQNLLEYHTSKEGPELISESINNKIKYCGKEDVFNFLKWHNILQLLPTNSYIDISNIHNRIYQRNKKLLEISEVISLKFKSEKINFCFLKGISLITTLYDDISLRTLGDIDIFVTKEDLNKVEIILKSMGFIQGNIINNQIVPVTKAQIKFQKIYTHELYQYVKQIDNEFFILDINHLFSWPGIDLANINVSLDSIIDEVCITAQNRYNLPILNNEYQFVHLCSHFYNESMLFDLKMTSEGNNCKEIRLFRLFDICFLLSHVALDINKINKICQSMNNANKIEYVLSFIYYIFENKIDMSNISQIFKIDNIENYNYYFLKDGSKKQYETNINEIIYNVRKNQK